MRDTPPDHLCRGLPPITAMAHVAQQYRATQHVDDFEYPEPNYPYLYAPRSEAGYTTPAVSHAPLPPNAPSYTYSPATSRPPMHERAYSDTSRSSGGDSYITPSLSASQVGNRMRTASHARSFASPRSRATSFVSREDLRNIPNGPPVHTPRSIAKPPALVPSPAVFSHPRAATTMTSSSTSSSRTTPMRRLRGVLKKPRPPQDDASYTSSSSAPEVFDEPQPMIEPSMVEQTYVAPAPAPMTESSSHSERYDHRRSMARSTAPSSMTIPRTRFTGNSDHVSRFLGKPWDARSRPRLDSAIYNAPAFEVRGIRSIQLIVAGLPWSVHVRAGASGSRSKSRSGSEQITVGDVVESVYSTLNKSLTRTDVRAASNDTKKRIARAASAAERESERGEQSAKTGKPCAARRIDYLGSRVWFLGLEKNDDFARREGYGITEDELKKSVEAGRPLSAYELHIKTQFTRGQAPLRGRIALPRDPRTRGETVLVFADGKAAQDAREAGAAHVGGEELIPKVLDGTLKPTKVI
ncbi:unnamed protein product [Rhizoctonia solani]|uniref:DUF6699 domain-containing protein n=1 Tax=Rhizoctonia solani TaxID=456999 RepID=A0A8H3AUV0_9AGAM|nr:unnamed protein product [Rhizoctonia solani]